jgi:hypothetical protein
VQHCVQKKIRFIFFAAAPLARSAHIIDSCGFQKSGDDKLERRLRRAHPKNPNGANLTTRRGACAQEDSFFFPAAPHARSAHRFGSAGFSTSWRGGFGEPTPETPTAPASRRGRERMHKKIQIIFSCSSQRAQRAQIR